MELQAPNGTHGGVRGRELITPSYSIQKKEQYRCRFLGEWRLTFFEKGNILNVLDII